jgi:type II secretion system protein N
MTRIPLWLKRVSASSAALLLFLYLTLILVPSAELQRLAARVIEPYGLTLTSTSFGKTFPLGIRANGLILSTQTGAVLSFDRITLKLKLLPLLIGKVILSCDAEIGKGIVEGEAEITGKGQLKLLCSKVRLDDIPFFSTVAGTQAKGELRIKGELQGKGSASKGYLQIEAKELDLRGVKISGTQLPDASYRTMQGMLRIAGGRTNLESVTLQGDGLYVRLSGDLPAGVSPAATPLNLKLELMPKPEFLESQKFIFLLLAKYTVTPGHYQLPIRGTLASPMLQ